MRKSDIAYVPNGPKNYYPVIPLQDMSLEEIKKKYIKTCGKANGNVSVCSKCKSPCDEGKRAIQLVANSVYNDPPIPLYGGKTLIERAKEENLKRREEAKAAEEKKEEVKEKKPKRKRMVIENWYEQAMASPDPTQWIMDAYKISKTKAKQKIYDYRYRHKDELSVEEKKEEKKEEIEEVKPEFTAKETQHESKVVSTDRFEVKLEALIKMQDEHKKAMDEYMKLYEQAKIEYEKIKQKTDILCNALDIVNE